VSEVILPEIKTPLPGPRAKKILERDQAVLSTSYVRPYPFVPAKGEGVWLEDVDGNRFLDLMSGIAVNTTGYNHPRVVNAVSEQAARFQHLCFSDFSSEPQVSLAERLNRLAGGGFRVYFGNSGTEAVEAAIKVVRYHTHRPYILAFTGAFHGRTLGSLALTSSNSKYRKGFAPLLPGVVHVPYPHPYRPPFGAKPEDAGKVVLDYLEHLFKTKLPPEEVGAIFFEPIQGEGGYIVPPAGFFGELSELARRYGILMVADEVQSGSGRTGRFLASEYENLNPDIVLLAKGMGTGYPISAILFKEELSSWPPGAHGTTFGGNPVAAAAAMATLDLLEEGLINHAASVGGRLMNGLRSLQADFPRLGDVRGRGLMIGLDFVKDPETREENPELRDQVGEAAFHKGLLTLPAGPSTLRLSPPLIISEAEADLAIELIGEVLKGL